MTTLITLRHVPDEFVKNSAHTYSVLHMHTNDMHGPFVSPAPINVGDTLQLPTQFTQTEVTVYSVNPEKSVDLGAPNHFLLLAE